MTEIVDYRNTFTAALEKCRSDGILCDFNLICEGKSIRVHKIILASHSSVFGAACSGWSKESLSDVYEIQEADFATVSQMVQYMYTGDYAVPSEHADEFVFHARMYSLGIMYMMKPLAEMARKRFGKSLRRTTSAAAVLRNISELYGWQYEGLAADKAACLRAACLLRRSGAALGAEKRKLLGEAAGETPRFCADLVEALLKDGLPKPTDIRDDRRRKLLKVRG